MMNEYRDTMNVANGTMGAMTGLATMAVTAVLMGRANRDAQHTDDWASHWARRAAAAERDRDAARGQAAGYRAEWSDAEDRVAMLASENARLRARIAALI